MSDFRVRTDLALEAREYMEETDEEIRGVKVEESFQEETDIRITKVIIETKNGAKAMGKPIGTYITLEAPNMIVPDEDYHREISLELAKQIRELIPDSNKEQSILAVGLGNREVTPDSLGPQVMGNLLITRHIVKEYGRTSMAKPPMGQIKSILSAVLFLVLWLKQAWIHQKLFEVLLKKRPQTFSLL